MKETIRTGMKIGVGGGYPREPLGSPPTKMRKADPAKITKNVRQHRETMRNHAGNYKTAHENQWGVPSEPLGGP
jgi:hypothetical protein